MINLPFFAPVGPAAIRVFAGYRLSNLTTEKFFDELGNTFMPGTPYMLAPLGLSAYIPAVLSDSDSSDLPDEIAIIVYASPEAYTNARENSLQGRMYTHSHAGVFDMAKSRGQFPGTIDEPNKMSGSDRWSWYLSNKPVDWQSGSTRVVVFSEAGGGSVQEQLRISTGEFFTKESATVDQMIVLATPKFGAVWIHGEDVGSTDIARLSLESPELRVRHDLTAKSVPMPNMTERVSITGPAAFSFKFLRDSRFFL